MYLEAAILWRHGRVCGIALRKSTLLCVQCSFNVRTRRIHVSRSRSNARFRTHLSELVDRCRVLYSLTTIMQMLTFAGLGCRFSCDLTSRRLIISTVFCSLRVYAVTSRSKIFSALVAALMTVFVVVQVVRRVMLRFF